MSGQGYHFAVGKGQADALLACSGLWPRSVSTIRLVRAVSFHPGRWRPMGGSSFL
jgi:hypothetical protein